MGQFSDKIFQDDKSLDVIDVIENEGLEGAFQWLAYVDQDEDEYYELNGYI